MFVDLVNPIFEELGSQKLKYQYRRYMDGCFYCSIIFKGKTLKIIRMFIVRKIAEQIW